MDQKLTKNLTENRHIIEGAFSDCADIVQRRFKSGNGNGPELLMIYTDNIVSGQAIEEYIMTNLMKCAPQLWEDGGSLASLEASAIAIGELSQISTFSEVFDAVLLGDTVLLMDGQDFALQASTKNFPTRGVGEAQTEVVVQGPKDAFTELSSVNIVLIRRRIKDTRLKVRRQTIGERSKTDVAVLFMKDIVREEILNEIEDRLSKIKIDAILDSGYIEQLLEKRWMSPFPQLQMTERPDKAASALLEGRVVIVVDNSPFVVMAPATMNVFFQAAEDYYERWEIMSFVRLLRYAAAAVAVSLPGLYVALTVYHPSMLPTALALKIAETRQNIPFPAIGEILTMELAFELLREAGVRLPSPVSSTIGIVGGIIIGQAAVEAGLVSPSVVIVASITGICSFVIPNAGFVSGIRITKYLILLLSAIMGLYGLWLGVILILLHLAALKSFGIPFLYPFCSASANEYNDLEDSLFRIPLFLMKKRPIFSSKNYRNRKKGEGP